MQGFERAAAIYVHCEGGCDRTGELVGAYRMRYFNTNVTEMYAEDVSECGRAPNYFATNGLEWFCLYFGENFNGPTGSTCTSFASCELFGKCKPTAESRIFDDTADSLSKSPFVSMVPKPLDG